MILGSWSSTTAVSYTHLDGVPDRIVFLPDTRVIFVELKTDTGRLNPLQKIQIDRLKKLGQWVEVVKGIRGVKMFFQDLGYTDTASRIATRCV